jgi:hypothetical protein
MCADFSGRSPLLEFNNNYESHVRLQGRLRGQNENVPERHLLSLILMPNSRITLPIRHDHRKKRFDSRRNRCFKHYLRTFRHFAISRASFHITYMSRGFSRSANFSVRFVGSAWEAIPETGRVNPFLLPAMDCAATKAANPGLSGTLFLRPPDAPSLSDFRDGLPVYELASHNGR